TPVLDGGLHRQSLLDLRKKHHLAEIAREAEIARHGFEDTGIAALVALMVLHDRRGRVAILRPREALDDVHRWEGLETELRGEARVDAAVGLEGLGRMPDIP